MSRLFLSMLLSSFLVLMPIGNSLAAPQHQQGYATSKAQAATIAQQRYGGKVLKVDKITRKEQTYYRVKLLSTKGKVHIVTIDAPQGRRK